ncbi:MAG: hypothetical protein Greene041662_54 [Candidatus Peregrinibacteria bacterium Greene0416_62]|nr:MAG: hypothetical protein Greene041662_54 [Candidatus Peregrinibacteria bacterium Greene0416_62]TSC98380.1 MAG: hypothetical protein Greene101449_946 [Candidatus Peregrinibacteria bacterium Greene1014_49]
MKKKISTKAYEGIFLKITPLYFQHLEYISIIIAFGYLAAISKSILVSLTAVISWLFYTWYVMDLFWEKYPRALINWFVVHIIMLPTLFIIGGLIIVSILTQIPSVPIPTIRELLKAVLFPWL